MEVTCVLRTGMWHFFHFLLTKVVTGLPRFQEQALGTPTPDAAVLCGGHLQCSTLTCFSASEGGEGIMGHACSADFPKWDADCTIDLLCAVGKFSFLCLFLL